MKLIAVTMPEHRRGEAREIMKLIDAGYWRVHLRKPSFTEEQTLELLDAIAPSYYGALSLHDTHHIAEQRGLGGIHLNSRNPLASSGFNGLVSKSCHTIEEIETSEGFDYLFLSPVFDSFSKQGYKAAFGHDELKRAPLREKSVFALGGVSLERLELIERLGFAGAAMMSRAWNGENAK